MVVLAGPNGCGKTSVIEACILALGSDKLLPNLREESQFIRKGSEQF
ncbi:MAG: AAA family ATPase, partial [Desulfobacterales bacterium]|nr:AAA family ATPase [Desulfobacterales bacterium]